MSMNNKRIHISLATKKKKYNINLSNIKSIEGITGPAFLNELFPLYSSFNSVTTYNVRNFQLKKLDIV